jgi:hypothetical protein
MLKQQIIGNSSGRSMPDDNGYVFVPAVGLWRFPYAVARFAAIVAEQRRRKQEH